MVFDIQMTRNHYSSLSKKVFKIRSLILTTSSTSEKILFFQICLNKISGIYQSVIDCVNFNNLVKDNL